MRTSYLNNLVRSMFVCVLLCAAKLSAQYGSVWLIYTWEETTENCWWEDVLIVHYYVNDEGQMDYWTEEGQELRCEREVHHYGTYEGDVYGMDPNCTYDISFGGGGDMVSGTSSWSGTVDVDLDNEGEPWLDVWELGCESAPAVAQITGLPDVVCVGEDYEVTAVSSGGPLDALQWSGDAEIVSTSGDNAVVRFNYAASNPTVIAKNNVGSSPTEVAVATTACNVSYSIPSRGSGLPVSIKYNANTNIDVVINPSIGSKSLSFKIVGGSSDNGQASFQGGSSLSGAGGTLTIRGTMQTEPGHAGNLSIRTDTKGGSMCGPSASFSVCAHPVATVLSGAIPWNAPRPTETAPVFQGMGVNVSWQSDSGNSSNLDHAFVSENIEFASSQTGSFSSVGFGGSPSGFQPANGTYGDIHGISSIIEGHDLVWRYDNLGAGTITDRQLDVFYCERCGMTAGDAREVERSGYVIGHYLISSGASNVHLDTTKYRAAVAHAGFFASPGVSDDVGVTVTLRN